MKNRTLRKVYLKHLNSILDRYQKDIFNANFIIAKELVKDIGIINSLLVTTYMILNLMITKYMTTICVNTQI